ncbi:MAG: cadherin-like beta sandwich domain-containing protein, partial [Spirochaetales bacterium]|nr:cadherin-like beta sandwich domain-containing protein [Spirochaetales bacterium]
MKKLVFAALTALVVLSILSGCGSMYGRGKGPIESFVFLAAKNPELPQNVAGVIVERPDPKDIMVVVPPGTFVRSLVATISLNTEATITVISSGSPVLQENGVTPNDFSTPVLYSVAVPGDKKPWEYRVTVREADTDARLASLSFPDGYALEPAFNPAVSSYSVEVPYAASTVKVDARAQSSYLKSITVDGRANPGAAVTATVDFASVQERTVVIETLAEDGVSAEQYSLRIRRGEPDRNAALAGLELKEGTLSPAFSPARLTYQAQVPFETQKLTVIAPAQSEVAEITLQDAQPDAPPLKVTGDTGSRTGALVEFATGERLPLLLRVTAQDGSIREYRIDVLRAAPDRNNLLATLSIPGAALTPAFAANRVAYVVAVPFSTQQVTIAAKPQSRYARMGLGPVSAEQGSLAVEGNVATEQGARLAFATVDRLPVLLTVTAQDGSERAYTLEVTRSDPDSNANLASLTATEGFLVPAFSPKTVSYTLSLPASAASVQLSATTESPVAAVGVLDDPSVQPVAALTLPLSVEAGQSRVISLITTAEDGTQKLYRLSVKRDAAAAAADSNALLMALQIVGARLEPEFAPTVSVYSASVGQDTESVTVAALPQSPTAKVLVDGQPLEPAGRRIAMAPGFTRVIQIEVRAEDGSVFRYTVQISRPAAGTSSTGSGDAHATSPQEDPASLPGGPPPGFGDGVARVLVEARNLRLQDREMAAMSAAGDRIGSQAEITVRYYRSDTVVARQLTAASPKQQGKSWTVSLSARTGPFSVEYGRLVEVQTAIRTGGGRYLYYTVAAPAEEALSLQIPFLLYGP